MQHSSAVAAHLDGASISLVWVLPFICMLLSIAVFPLLAPQFWEHHFGKISAFWSAAFIFPFAAAFGGETAATEAMHTMVAEYLPFIILLFALFVVAGGIRVAGNLVGTPTTNTGLLAFGTLIASALGTTGASMLLIRPMISANQDRRRNVHVFVFFIFLVSNIGGSLTPLGDPPLFLGFLKGVDFSWTVTAMLSPMLLASGLLLVLFYFIDAWAWRKEPEEIRFSSRVPRQIRIEGLHNIIYLGGVIAAVLVSGHLEASDQHPGWLRDHSSIGGCRSRPVAVGAELFVMENDAPGDPHRKCLRLDANSGSGDSLHRDLHHHDPRPCNSSGRP